MFRISYALKRATHKRPPEKKLRLRSRKVGKRYGTVNGVHFCGKIEFEEGTEKTPIGKP